MEEQKNSKEIKMTPNKGEKTMQKLTYEQLNQACADMSQQLQQQNNYLQRLLKQNQEMEYMLQTRRLDYMFKIVELSKTNSEYSFPSDVVYKCIDEIGESLYPKDTPEKENKEEE